MENNSERKDSGTNAGKKEETKDGQLGRKINRKDDTTPAESSPEDYQRKIDKIC